MPFTRFGKNGKCLKIKGRKKTQEGVKTGTKVFFNELLMEL
jgi:hypothetical protein